MADSIFVMLSSGALPRPNEVTARYAELGEAAALDDDWTWETLEGWLPASYLGEASGFEAICDAVTSEVNAEFVVPRRPELDFLVELTPRGGMLSYACAATFAAAIGGLGDGVIEAEEGSKVAADQVATWLARQAADWPGQIKDEAEADARRARLAASGDAPEFVLDEALRQLVGQRIEYCKAPTMIRVADGSTIHGEACELSYKNKTVLKHGHSAALRDQQCGLLREQPVEENKLVARNKEIEDGLPAAKAQDEAAMSQAAEITAQWPGKVSISSASQIADQRISLETSDGHRIDYTATDNFSIISIHISGLFIGLNGFDLTVG